MSHPLVRFINTLVYSGLEAFGKYYSKYRAFVYDVEDPENLQRIKLIIPQISGDQAYNYWAFPTGVFAGEGYGSQILPKKGDVVWVEFEGGSPEVPIWSHGHFSRKEIPTNDKDLKDVNCYWLITPKGNKVKLYDTKNYVHIENVTGNYVQLNEKGASIVSDKSVSLGKLDKSDYKALKGEPTQEVLEDIEDVLTQLQDAMQKDIGNFTSKGFVNMVTMIPQIKIKIGTLKQKINKILSNKVTLD